MASTKSTMLDLAEAADMDRILRPGQRLKPGEYLARQPAAVREKLRGLKSEDVAGARWPLWD